MARLIQHDLAAPRTTTPWVIYGVLLVSALVIIWVTSPKDPEPAPLLARPPMGASEARDTSGSAGEQVPELKLDQLAQREEHKVGGNPADARSWAEAEAARRSAEAAPPTSPQAPPPLPFVYIGRMVDGKRGAVFLTNSSGDRTWVVRVGDLIEDVYRVEDIRDTAMTLTYLPLYVRQELALPGALLQSVAPTLPGQPPPRAPPPLRAPLPTEIPLLFAAPSKVTVGNELVVNIGVAPGRGAKSAHVELTYDPTVLAAIAPSGSGGGRVTLNLAEAAGVAAQVRFKVIAESPMSTQIGIENATALDARGATVAIAAPPAHEVAIVQAAKTN